MNDPLDGFDWASLHREYDARCVRYDSRSPHLACFGADRPGSDRELYYRLIYRYSAPARAIDPVGTYQALLYWKLYSQPTAMANLSKWMKEGSELRRAAEKQLPNLLKGLSATLQRRVDVVIAAVRRLGQFRIPGMISTTALPVRTTFLHFIYPSTVPIFDQMVLRAVGVNEEGANRNYQVFQEYLPFAW
jgi:hypothetical protein